MPLCLLLVFMKSTATFRTKPENSPLVLISLSQILTPTIFIKNLPQLLLPRKGNKIFHLWIWAMAIYNQEEQTWLHKRLKRKKESGSFTDLTIKCQGISAKYTFQSGGEGKREGEGWRERKAGKRRKLIKRSKRKGRPTGAVENNGLFKLPWLQYAECIREEKRSPALNFGLGMRER